MEAIEDNYQAFLLRKTGVFSVEKEPAEYKFPDGWAKTKVTKDIIGETENTYVTHFLNSEHGEWIGDVVILRKYKIPMGIHKSRLLEWIPCQLFLYE